jgi:hypothetical protein
VAALRRRWPGVGTRFVPLASPAQAERDDLCASGLLAYDEVVKQIPCVCGYVVQGEDDDELWQNAQAHMRQDHPDLEGKVSRADLLAQAEEIPRPTS